jgi:hypothetical protein
MRYAAPKCALFLSLVTSLCLCQQLSLRMTNQDVIDMVALGLSDDVIIAKIHTVDSTNFDTSVKGLRALKAGKVSDAVIRTMINAKSAAAAINDNAQVVNDIGLPAEIGVYLLNNSRLVEIEPEIVGWQTGGVLKQYATLGIDRGHINGKVMKPRSSVQLSNPIVFLIKTSEGTSATEYQLLRLYGKDNRREFRAVTGGVYHASGGAERNALAFSPEKISNRVWRIRLDHLENGEYGFLPPGFSAMSISASGKLYSFGVSEEGGWRNLENSGQRLGTPASTSTTTPVSAMVSTVVPSLGIAVGAGEGGRTQITEIQLGGTAQVAGLQVGYIINTIDGKSIRTASDLATELSNKTPGSQIRLGYLFHSALGYMSNQKVLTLASSQ